MDAADPLVQTKLSAPPSSKRLVARPRIEQQIREAVDDPAVRLILVSAPAGSGKSTLVAAALASIPIRTAWLQIDASDHDPVRFWTYVVEALAHDPPAMRTATASTLPMVGADPRPLVERLAAQLAAGEPTTLVVDDYHLVANDAVDDGIELLLAMAPPSFTLVLCTRVEPAMRLARLRVAGQLAEIRVDQLRFEHEEALELMQESGGQFDPAHARALCDRTEGWAAGLVLAALSMAASSDRDAFVAEFRGNDRLVVDYLTDEFLRGVPSRDLDRMLMTSMLGRMSGSLVDAVCETEDGATWLRDLAAANQLVIGLDSTGTWFRYHHLLADLLALEAEQRLGAELPELHRRAGRWHLDHGSAYDAVEHFSRSDDRDTAAEVIYDEAHDLLNRGQLETVRRQIERLGVVGEQHAGSRIVSGFIALLTGDLGGARDHVAAARDLGPNADESGLLGALAINVAIASGDVTAARAEAEQTQDPFESTQTLSLAAIRVWAGDFSGAEPLLDLASRFAADEPNGLVAASTPIYRAIAALESGDTTTAAAAAQRALDLAAAAGWADAPQVALASSIAGRTSDDAGEAITAVRRGVELAGRSAMVLTRAYALASAADVLFHHRVDDAAAHLRDAQFAIDRCVDPGIAGRYVARVAGRHGHAERVQVAELVEELTERELSVLRYLPSHMSQREIASELYVSLNTVKTHCKAIYRKLAVDGRKPAVQAARDHGLL